MPTTTGGPSIDTAIGRDGYAKLGAFLSDLVASTKATVDAGTVGAVVYGPSRREVLRAAGRIATIVSLRTEVALGEVGRDDDEDEGFRFFVTVQFSWEAFS